MIGRRRTALSAMHPEDFKLLIHHHDVAYVAKPGEIWLTAGIGRWVSALSAHFKEIGLLLHTSARPLPRQDTPVTKENVRLYSLGPPGHYWDRLPRMRRIRQACRQAGSQADGLLIRGLTPRQYTVWQHTPVPRKAFLLIRSPRQSRITDLSLMTILSEVINKYREHEFSRIAKNDTLLMVNSPVHLPAIEKISGKKAHFVPTNTIRAAEFAPLQVRPISVPLKLLYVGRLHLLKGLRELFQAISILQQQGYPCVLDLVAAQEEPVYAQLRALAGQLGITGHINWRGYVPFGPELFDFYQAADVFVLPTYTEGFPRVLWEAAASCCPMVTTSVGGIPSLLAHETHALLIPPKDVQAIVISVKRLLSDSLLRRELVEQAYRHALEFSVEACAKKLALTLSGEWS